MDNITKPEKRLKEGFVGQQMVVLAPDKKKWIAKNPFCRNLFPTAIGYFPKARHHNRKRKKGADEYILLYCIEGEGWIKVNGEVIRLIPNTCFIIPENTPHHYASSEKDAWSIYWVHFSGGYAKTFYDRFSEPAGQALQIAFDETRIRTFNEVTRLMENDFVDREAELIHCKLISLLSTFSYCGMSDDGDKDDKINASISFMKSNINQNLSIHTLADYANYSVSRYSELFRQKTGLSPIHYFIRLKIQASCQYLYFTNLKIKEICREVGFEDAYYFSRMFKKQIGISPMEYKKMHG